MNPRRTIFPIVAFFGALALGAGLAGVASAEWSPIVSSHWSFQPPWHAAPAPTPSPSPEGCFCPQVFHPVCGIDGETYGNHCEAECADVPVVHPGQCHQPEPPKPHPKPPVVDFPTPKPVPTPDVPTPKVPDIPTPEPIPPKHIPIPPPESPKPPEPIHKNPIVPWPPAEWITWNWKFW